MHLEKRLTLIRQSKIMRKMNVSGKNSEKLMVLDLLLSSGFKAYNIPTLACQVALSIDMYR